MKIDKSNYSLTFMGYNNGYEGTFTVNYLDKMFGKDITIHDFANINEESRPLNDAEILTRNQLNKIIDKELNKKGYKLDNWTILYSKEGGTLKISYLFGETNNVIDLNLINDSMVTKKALYLSRKITKRLLRELR